MFRSHRVLVLVLVALPAILPPTDPEMQSANLHYRAQTTRWRAADGQFAGWQLSGVALTAGSSLQLDPRTAQTGTDPYGPGKYKGGNFYNGGSFVVGEATGPVVTPAFSFSEAIPSWNAVTPPGTWLEVQLRTRIGTRWTGWYNMGVWTSAEGAVTRHSVSDQADSDAYVDVDTLKLGQPGKPLAATAYQMQLRLFSASRNPTQPSVSSAALVVSTKPSAPTRLAPGNPARWNKLIRVPECSQMVYHDGGEVWCSPTSVAMVLNYWRGQTGAAASCETAVRAAVSGVYDRMYDGHGNWPFNTAYAASRGMEAYITRFTSVSQAEEWIAAGVPVIMSVGWGKNQLTGAPIPTSNGHLIVLVGFDTSGNPIVNDPAASSNGAVQRTYSRGELERLWLERSGGTAYLIFPAGKAVPRP